MSEKDERITKEIRSIKNLDLSIGKLAVQLDEAKKQTTALTAQIREMLTEQLSHAQPTDNVLIDNARRFLDLFNDSAKKDVCNGDRTMSDIMETQLELHNKNADISLSMGDEEERLNILTNDSTDESMVNPYRIDKSLGKSCEEIQYKPAQDYQ